MIWLTLLACQSGFDQPVVLLLPDEGRLGADGEDGPAGAARVYGRWPTRVTEAVPLRIVYPSDAEGRPVVEDAPAMVLIHGGFVHPERYEWLALHWASRGYVVALPEAASLLALREPGNAELTRDALLALSAGDPRAPDLEGLVGARWGLAGHSLGGVAASSDWAQDDSWAALCLLASFPAASTPLDEAADRPVMALLGTTDATLDPDEVRESLSSFPTPPRLRLIPGMNHYAWTDSARPAELRRDGPSRRPLAETRRDAHRFLDPYLDQVLLPAPSGDTGEETP